jgi:DNA-binding LytR/AlgR family response regulator
MKVVIIEDEEFAARRLERMIYEIDAEIQVAAKLESVAGSVEWFQNHDVPDLVFMDIHLEDNLSFAIFDNISIACPIVFTTATDEMSTRAFKLKKIDFLLKPIVHEELLKVIEKYGENSRVDDRLIDAAFFSEIVRKQ